MNSAQSTRFGKRIGEKIAEVREREAKSGERYWKEAGGPFLTWADRYTFEERKYDEMLPLYLAHHDKRTIEAKTMWEVMAWRKAVSYFFRLYEWQDAGSVGVPPYVTHGGPVVTVG
jgi:hypothetical protein